MFSLITKKDREIEDLEEKRLLIESRSRSLEHENDSLRLALRLVAQDRSGDDSHQQEDCWRQDFSDDEDVSNEIMHPINRVHFTTEVNSQDKKSKFNRYLPRKLHSLESGFQGGPASDRIGIK